MIPLSRTPGNKAIVINPVGVRGIWSGSVNHTLFYPCRGGYEEAYKDYLAWYNDSYSKFFDLGRVRLVAIGKEPLVMIANCLVYDRWGVLDLDAIKRSFMEVELLSEFYDAEVHTMIFEDEAGSWDLIVGCLDMSHKRAEKGAQQRVFVYTGPDQIVPESKSAENDH